MPHSRSDLLRALKNAATADEVDQMLSQIEAAWPDVRVDAAQFAAALQAAWLKTDRSVPMGKLAVADLYLAFACLQNDPVALKALDRLLQDVTPALRRQADAHVVEETLQRTRERLLLPLGGNAPKLSLYAGRGSLSAFLRIVAINVLRNLISSDRHLQGQRESDDKLPAVNASTDVERRVGGMDQQVKFREAFREAVRALPLRDRTMLRLNVLDGLSIDDLAPLYKVSRATAARWLASARARLVALTKDELQATLRLDGLEAERLLESIKSGFELSLSGVLRESMQDEAKQKGK